MARPLRVEVWEAAAGDSEIRRWGRVRRRGAVWASRRQVADRAVAGGASEIQARSRAPHPTVARAGGVSGRAGETGSVSARLDRIRRAGRNFRRPTGMPAAGCRCRRPWCANATRPRPGQRRSTAVLTAAVKASLDTAHRLSQTTVRRRNRGTMRHLNRGIARLSMTSQGVAATVSRITVRRRSPANRGTASRSNIAGPVTARRVRNPGPHLPASGAAAAAVSAVVAVGAVSAEAVAAAEAPVAAAPAAEVVVIAPVGAAAAARAVVVAVDIRTAAAGKRNRNSICVSSLGPVIPCGAGPPFFVSFLSAGLNRRHRAIAGGPFHSVFPSTSMLAKNMH